MEFGGCGKLQTFGEILKPLQCFQVHFEPLLEGVQTHIPPAALGIRVCAAPHVLVACSEISDKMPKTFLQGLFPLVSVIITWLLNQADPCFLFFVKWILNSFAVQQKSLNRLKQDELQSTTASNKEETDLAQRFEGMEEGSGLKVHYLAEVLTTLQTPRCEIFFQIFLLANPSNEKLFIRALTSSIQAAWRNL